MIDFETHSSHCLFNNYPVQYRIQKCSVKPSANKVSKMNECLMFQWLPVYKCIKSRHNLEVRSPVQDYEIWGMVSGCVFVFSWEQRPSVTIISRPAQDRPSGWGRGGGVTMRHWPTPGPRPRQGVVMTSGAVLRSAGAGRGPAVCCISLPNPPLAFPQPPQCPEHRSKH